MEFVIFASQEARSKKQEASRTKAAVSEFPELGGEECVSGPDCIRAKVAGFALLTNPIPENEAPADETDSIVQVKKGESARGKKRSDPDWKIPT